MKSLTDMLSPVKNALLSVSKNVGLHEAIDATKTHIVYAPDSEAGGLALDNIKTGQIMQGTIDLYAEVADAWIFDSIQNALNDAGISFQLNSIQHEDMGKNDMIHYEWIFEVA